MCDELRSLGGSPYPYDQQNERDLTQLLSFEGRETVRHGGRGRVSANCLYLTSRSFVEVEKADRGGEDFEFRTPYGTSANPHLSACPGARGRHLICDVTTPDKQHVLSNYQVLPFQSLYLI